MFRPDYRRLVVNEVGFGLICAAAVTIRDARFEEVFVNDGAAVGRVAADADTGNPRVVGLWGSLGKVCVTGAQVGGGERRSSRW